MIVRRTEQVSQVGVGYIILICTIMYHFDRYVSEIP